MGSAEQIGIQQACFACEASDHVGGRPCRRGVLAIDSHVRRWSRLAKSGFGFADELPLKGKQCRSWQGPSYFA
jgi:hypothetical protein